MKALSVVRPGGSLIASGRKTLEIRRWLPELDPSEDLLIVENGRYLREDGEQDEDGVAVAVVKVARVRPFTPDDVAAACASIFEEGWFAWELVGVRQIPAATRVLAARGIYQVQVLT